MWFQERIPGAKVAHLTEAGLPSCADHTQSLALGKCGLHVDRAVDTEPAAGAVGQ